MRPARMPAAASTDAAVPADTPATSAFSRRAVLATLAGRGSRHAPRHRHRTCPRHRRCRPHRPAHRASLRRDGAPPPRTGPARHRVPADRAVRPGRDRAALRRAALRRPRAHALGRAVGLLRHGDGATQLCAEARRQHGHRPARRSRLLLPRRPRRARRREVQDGRHRDARLHARPHLRGRLPAAVGHPHRRTGGRAARAAHHHDADARRRAPVPRPGPRGAAPARRGDHRGRVADQRARRAKPVHRPKAGGYHFTEVSVGPCPASVPTPRTATTASRAPISTAPPPSTDCAPGAGASTTNSGTCISRWRTSRRV